MENEEIFEILPFNNALDFINALRLTNSRWMQNAEWDQEWERVWYFRGHGDARWSLLPSVHREEKYLPSVLKEMVSKDDLGKQLIDSVLRTAQKSHKSKVSIKTQVSLCHNALCEHILTEEFVNLADSLGYNVPQRENKKNFGNFIFKELFQDFIDSPKYWAHPSVVIAQHHGVPTRLMDWTSNPLVAAYFAASNVPDYNNKGEIAVYAINKIMMREPIIFVDAPKSYSPNLQAQYGILSLDTNADSYFLKNKKYPTLQQSLVERNPNIKSVSYKIGKKLTLPISEVGNLLRLLWIENVSIAHLMPTLDK